MSKQNLMAYARGDKPVDLAIKNAQVVNVFTGKIMETTVGIHEGIIVGFGAYQARSIVDAKGAYMVPGFIDGHVHIESSMLLPGEFAKVIVPKGTTSIIADPHEIANVTGVKGIEYLLKLSEAIPLNVYMMAPSCVPATPFEHAGGVVNKDDIAKLKTLPGILGLGEVMDYPSVINGEREIFAKLEVMNDRMIDGHAPDITGMALNAYCTAGVKTDHECTTQKSMNARLDRGMFVHLREGSQTRNVRDLLPGVTKENSHNLLFCTDDKHPEDILREGHINYNVNLATAYGIDPIRAIQMATINTARAYKLDNIGAIAPGYKADFFLSDSIESITPYVVYKDGRKVAEDEKALFEVQSYKDSSLCDTVHIDVDKLDFTLPLTSKHVYAIGIVKNNITTTKETVTVDIEDGHYVHNARKDLLKIAVIERHHRTNQIGVALLKGFGLSHGAIAMSIAHDSHNIIVVGDSDQAMRTAVIELEAMHGGIVVVKDDEVHHALALEVAGIISMQPYDVVAESLKTMTETVRGMGVSKAIDDPFITLAFLALPVIPALKITDQGLFDVEQFSLIDLEVDKS
ncbi:MAG: adenine deaminase [Bacillota bacterium]